MAKVASVTLLAGTQVRIHAFSFKKPFFKLELKLFKVVDSIASIKITNQHIISWEHCMAEMKMQQKIDICILVTMHITYMQAYNFQALKYFII